MSEPRADAVPVASDPTRRSRNRSDLLFVGLGGIALILLQGRITSLGPQEIERTLVQPPALDLTHLAQAPPPIAAAAMALLGPLLLRLPWRAGLAMTGFAWIMLVGLALHLERTAEVGLDVLPPAIGLAGTLMLALVLQRRLRRAARSADHHTAAADASGRVRSPARRRS